MPFLLIREQIIGEYKTKREAERHKEFAICEEPELNFTVKKVD